jgi:glycosyltransferase involved in cell wall biosynthesis
MDIGIDCSCVAKAQRTGVARYCVSLLAELPAALGPDDSVTLLYRFSRLKRRRFFERVDDPRFRVSVFQDGLPLPRRLDVVHGPDLRIPRTRTPCVSTVHDLSALELPEIASEAFRQRKYDSLSQVAERARLILCISDVTERVMLERFPAARGRTRVVPLGISPGFEPQDAEVVQEVRERLGLPERYLLFVGQISRRKNLLPLIDAFGRLHLDARFRDVGLVLAGPVQTGGETVVTRVHESAATDSIHMPGFVADEDLPPLYAGAQAFCFTGKAEGFGLPILEAMACGSPVVAARAGANVSTAGGAAELVDPDEPSEIRAALASILDDRTHRERLVADGLRRAQGCTWKETVRKTVEAYRDALGEGAAA